jgi:thiol-disulfide isomerase/thioredoxin
MDPVGLGAIAAVLVVGFAAGVWRRRTDGRLRDATVPAARPSSPEARPASAATARASGESPGGVSSGSASDSRVMADQHAEPGVITREPDERLDPALLRELGVGPARVTLLQFSSAFCAPCRAVRRVSSEVAGMLPGVEHVEVDAESHLDAVRALGIWRTPTLLVLDADGRVVKRATGVPAKPQLIAVIGELLP